MFTATASSRGPGIYANNIYEINITTPVGCTTQDEVPVRK